MTTDKSYKPFFLLMEHNLNDKEKMERSSNVARL
jgi:hypothetical protein